MKMMSGSLKILSEWPRESISPTFFVIYPNETITIARRALKIFVNSPIILGKYSRANQDYKNLII
jgi:hypothetical protein